jgi:hypothetical protein
MLPLLVQLFSNEESTNIIPVPWMLAGFIEAGFMESVV